ncbi:helicase-associated domain-containing protein [Corynebacterium variabile]|uniref:helicase-associated domain-containing protein n=1 Tax=Corynebacterium variabile TaxID=1727 RepID=UPI00264905CC|nr:helicase-associated domain-containing protein [Corynebacterium variabile]MDN6676424.1 helicase-associated domain-containing protein [Corynebacterium variabile]
MPDNTPFPSYGDWLTAHDDATLVDLLWRMRAIHGRTFTADVAALRQLDARSLAVLHGLARAGAAHHPVDASSLSDALTSLFDEAGTPATGRPTTAEIPEVLRSLAHRGLAYGPGLHIDNAPTGDDGPDPFPVAIPGDLQGFFTGTTDLPWALVDGYRCPVPTVDLPDVLAELPDRQRRLLGTLATAGGIGHSASLDDPERPLARMIAAGLLDRVDAETARLSPRVGAVIAGRVTPDPGGDFTTPEPVPVTDRADGAGVARAVETLRQVTELLTVLGTAPLRPLGGGGVGVREITRVAKATDTTTDEVTGTLLLCRHADLIGPGLPVPAPEVDTAGPDGEVWGVTDRGVEFLAAGMARRWALLLSGWSTSPHSPWEMAETGTHLLQDSLDHPTTAALRELTAELVTVLGPTQDAPADAHDAAVQLWRLRPSLAAKTPTQAVAGVLAEAEALGLRADGQSTSAAVALASDAPADALTTALTGVLPAPVSMLIIQADMTVLAPGLLAPDDEAMLRAIADVESTGMASVWRISPESLKRAAAAGETADRVRGFLAGMAPEIPQGLDYLINDAFRSSGAMTAGTASTILTAPDEATLTSALTMLASLSDGEVRDAALRRIAPTVAVSRTQLSRVVSLLEDAGVRVGVDGDAAATTHGPVLSLVPDPRRPSVSREEVEDQLAGTVEGLRRTRQAVSDAEDPEGTDLPDVETVRDPHQIMATLRSAYDRGTRVEISYVNADGSAVQEWISVVTMSPVSIVGVTESDGVSLRIQPHRIAWVAAPV